MPVVIAAMIEALCNHMDRALSMAADVTACGTPEAVAWAASASANLLRAACGGAMLVPGGDGATTEEKKAADKRPAAMFKKPSEHSLGFLRPSSGFFVESIILSRKGR
ncbi:hypothetical protein [Paenibacillus methanolicus]|uniref:hypothetical protein n=1 Tax=Paenibacillus methanolicus TaxID=582686 RepID=UPI0011E6F66C|nr:hypothetical protein [Paenibacillus methanolicus]